MSIPLPVVLTAVLGLLWGIVERRVRLYRQGYRPRGRDSTNPSAVLAVVQGALSTAVFGIVVASLFTHGWTIAVVALLTGFGLAAVVPAKGPERPSRAAQVAKSRDSPARPGSGIETVPVAALTRSSRQSRLPEDLVKRVERLAQSLSGVYDQSLTEWIDGFERDADPRAEIRWWEHLAGAYERLVADADIRSDRKTVAFSLASKIALGAPRSQLADELRQLPPGSYDAMRQYLGVSG